MIFRIHFSVLCPQFQTYLKKVTTIVSFWSTLRIFINFKLTFNCAVYFNPDTGFTNDELMIMKNDKKEEIRRF